MVRLTKPEGSVVRPNLAEPPSSADTDADADSSVVHKFVGLEKISYVLLVHKKGGLLHY